ncbi:MAG: hypothetical protein AAFQ67_04870, partial [Pseudomonadota bacterium]
ADEAEPDFEDIVSEFQSADDFKAREDLLQKYAAPEEGATPEQEKRARFAQREAVFAAASSKQTEADIRHGLSGLTGVLPSNPRRIKRIVNMIALYQASAQSAAGVREGSDEWKALALWIILMAEHPKDWRRLCENHANADKIVTASPDADLKTLEVTSVHAFRLIRGDAFEEEGVRLDSAAVAWLRRLTPIEGSGAAFGEANGAVANEA